MIMLYDMLTFWFVRKNNKRDSPIVRRALHRLWHSPRVCEQAVECLDIIVARCDENSIAKTDEEWLPIIVGGHAHEVPKAVRVKERDFVIRPGAGRHGNKRFHVFR